MNEMNGIIVAHPYKQHSYKTVAALQGEGLLNTYVTTIYKKKHSLSMFYYKLLPSKIKKKFDRYYSDDVDEDNIVLVCTTLALICHFLDAIPSLSKVSGFFTHLLLKKFNEKVVKIVKKQKPNILIAFDTLSGDALEQIRKENIPTKIFVDMAAPFLYEMLAIYQEKMAQFPFQLKSIERKFNTRTYKEKLERASKELLYADRFLCASTFTANTLKKYGIEESKISICRYDIPQNPQSVKTKVKETGQKLKGVFIGNVAYTKGVHDILSALEQLTDYVEKFTFVGAIQDHELVDNAIKDICEFVGYVTHERVLEICAEADFSIFPSLADGYGFAVTECLQNGVPVICSSNAGACDYIKNWVNGVVFEPGNVDSICTSIIDMYSDKDSLQKMQVNAKKISQIDNSYSRDLINAVTNDFEK